MENETKPEVEKQESSDTLPEVAKPDAPKPSKAKGPEFVRPETDDDGIPLGGSSRLVTK